MLIVLTLFRGNVYGLGVYSSNEIQAKIKTTIDIPTIKSSELAPITYWKAVNTLSPNGTGVSFKGKKSQCIFSNFMINGKMYHYLNVARLFIIKEQRPMALLGQQLMVVI